MSTILVSRHHLPTPLQGQRHSESRSLCTLDPNAPVQGQGHSIQQSLSQCYSIPRSHLSKVSLSQGYFTILRSPFPSTHNPGVNLHQGHTSLRPHNTGVSLHQGHTNAYFSKVTQYQSHLSKVKLIKIIPYTGHSTCVSHFSRLTNLQIFKKTFFMSKIMKFKLFPGFQLYMQLIQQPKIK